jgi:hypothetical protein
MGSVMLILTLTTGNIFHFIGAPILWKTKLQKTISLSMAVADYYAASTAAVEIIYLRPLPNKIPSGRIHAMTPDYEGNNACIKWSNYVNGGLERAL